MLVLAKNEKAVLIKTMDGGYWYITPVLNVVFVGHCDTSVGGTTYTDSGAIAFFEYKFGPTTS